MVVAKNSNATIRQRYRPITVEFISVECLRVDHYRPNYCNVVNNANVCFIFSARPAQSRFERVSFGIRLDPIPTQTTPAPNHARRLACSGSTPPVGMNFSPGNRGLMALRNPVPVRCQETASPAMRRSSPPLKSPSASCSPGSRGCRPTGNTPQSRDPLRGKR